MPRHSAGILLYRVRGGAPEVFLVHPGGPFWTGKDDGAWSIPKGEFDPEQEDALAAALREFAQETGFVLSVSPSLRGGGQGVGEPQEGQIAGASRTIPAKGPFLPLTTIRQRSGKIIHAWAIEFAADQGERFDPAAIRSNTFSMEWPPRSSQKQEFPEIDRAAFFDILTARLKITLGQAPMLDELENMLPRRTKHVPFP